MTDVLPRRERVRQETTAEIKRRAWALMADSGPDALSLRAVARQMGMASSAMYRYFRSRDDLLTALLLDGFDGLADALRDAYEASRTSGDGAEETCVAVFRTYRTWALEHRSEFLLIYSTVVPGYEGTDETTAAAVRVSDVLLDVLADLLAQGQVDLDLVAAETADPYRERLEAWSAQSGHGLPPAALAAAVRCYAALHGIVHLEIHSHLPPALLGSADMFESTMRAVLSGFLTAPAGGGRVRPVPAGD